MGFVCTQKGKMMSDYIKREDAIKAFDPLHRQDWYTPWIVETLEDLPSADVAPVVRCKDCTHFRTFRTSSDGEEIRMCVWKGIVDLNYNDFCSKGERNENE